MSGQFILFRTIQIMSGKTNIQILEKMKIKNMLNGCLGN